jgi:hypothetical protein
MHLAHASVCLADVVMQRVDAKAWLFFGANYGAAYEENHQGT